MDQHNTVLNLSSSDLNLPFPQISDKRIYVIKLESINPYIETVCRLFFSRSEKLTDYMWTFFDSISLHLAVIDPSSTNVKKSHPA